MTDEERSIDDSDEDKLYVNLDACHVNILHIFSLLCVLLLFSFTGIGWRPSGLTKQCKNFPVLGPPLEDKCKS